MKHLSRRIGKLEARIGPQERRADERVRELIQRRCQRLSIPYEEPSLEPRRAQGKMGLTEVLREHFARPSLADGVMARNVVATDIPKVLSERRR